MTIINVLGILKLLVGSYTGQYNLCWADCQPHKSGDLHGQATKLPGEIAVILTKKIGKRTEYTESVRHSCGHTIDYVTLGYKMERRQVAQKRQIPCGRCQLVALLKAPGNA